MSETTTPQRKSRVYIANPYRPRALGSLGDGAYLLIRQFNFPLEYSDQDKHVQADHDRCFMWDYKHASRCFKQHTGTGDLGFEQWVDSAKDEQVIAFLADILKATASVVWTGYRIMGTVNRSNGYPVWTLELFAKGPMSDTKTYTGPNAPNVRPLSRRLIAGIDW
jgi:hypothetical protein